MIGTGGARELTGVDQVLAAPDVDDLVADVQIGGDLRDAVPGGDGVKGLAT